MNEAKWSTVKCDSCGVEFRKYTSQLRPKNFCSRKCFYEYASARMTAMNQELNPSRMTPKTREKLREARLDSGGRKTYTKTYGRHTHRVVAEEILGRPLLPGEVVHHLDGNKRNNAPENLKIYPSQAEHIREHVRSNPNWGRKRGECDAVCPETSSADSR